MNASRPTYSPRNAYVERNQTASCGSPAKSASDFDPGVAVMWTWQSTRPLSLPLASQTRMVCQIDTHGQTYFPSRSTSTVGTGLSREKGAPTEVMKPASATTVHKPGRRDDVAGSTTLAFLRMRRGTGSLRTHGFAASFGRLDVQSASAQPRCYCKPRHNSLVIPSLLGRTWVFVSMRHSSSVN